MKKHILFACPAVWGLAAGATASAQEVRTSATVSVGGSYGTNPFLGDDGDTSAASAYIQVDPRVFLEDETTTASLTGQFRLGYYPDRYGTDQTVRLDLNGEHRLSERLRLSARAGFQTSRSAAQDLILGPPFVLDADNAVPELPFLDPTVAGLNTRTNSINLGAGLEYASSPVDAFSLGVDHRLRLYDDLVGTDFRQTAATLQYGRRVSEKMVLKAGLEVGLVDYEGRQAGDAVVVGPTVGADWQLSETAQLSARVGASIARIDLGPAGNQTSTYLAGSLSYCDRLLGGSLCVSADRSARPTGFAGISAISGFGFGYSRQINEADSLSVSLRYAQTSQVRRNGFSTTTGWKSEFGGGSATYSHAFNERLKGFVTASASKVVSDIGRRDPNFGVSAGIAIAFGDRN